MLKGIDFFDQLIHCTDCKSSLGQFDLGYIMKFDLSLDCFGHFASTHLNTMHLLFQLLFGQLE